MPVPTPERPAIKTLITKYYLSARVNEKAYWWWWLSLRIAATICTFGAIICASIATVSDAHSKLLNAAVVVLTAAAGGFTGAIISQFDFSEKWERWSRYMKEWDAISVWVDCETTDEPKFRSRLEELTLFDPEVKSVKELEETLSKFQLH